MSEKEKTTKCGAFTLRLKVFFQKIEKKLKKSVDKREMAWYYKQAPRRAATESEALREAGKPGRERLGEEFDDRAEDFGRGQIKALCKLNNTKNKHKP